MDKTRQLNKFTLNVNILKYAIANTIQKEARRAIQVSDKVYLFQGKCITRDKEGHFIIIIMIIIIFIKIIFIKKE